jgi:hypothetical protein
MWTVPILRNNLEAIYRFSVSDNVVQRLRTVFFDPDLTVGKIFRVQERSKLAMEAHSQCLLLASLCSWHYSW